MYLQRPTGNDGKAGNLNYAFKRSSSDVIAVFDADFIIKRHFLMCMLPHMLEPTYERPFEYRLGRCGEWLTLLAAALTVTLPHMHRIHGGPPASA